MKRQKKLFVVATILAATTFFSSCKKDDQTAPSEQGQVSMSFQIMDQQLKGGSLKIAPVTSYPASIVVVIVDNEGNKVKDYEKLELIKFGDDYVTKALTLDLGNYKLSEYYVLDQINRIIYVTPIAGSAKASWVSEPLSIAFNVSKDEVTKLAPEVVAIAESNPEDFGYATFRLNLINSFDFLVSVFAYNDKVKSYDLVSARVTVEGNGKVLASKDIPALTDTISVPDNVDPFIIKVEKEGYTTFTDTITNSELKKYFDSTEYGPLKVYLELCEYCNFGTVTDIDGNIYKTIKIGNQVWMAENLKVTNFNDGTQILNVTDSAEWNSLKTSGYCWYNNDSSFMNPYGALYNWYAVNTG